MIEIGGIVMNTKSDSSVFPLVMLLMVMILFAYFFWIYFIKIKIKDSTARKIEIVGYYFLCVLVIWEFGVKNIMMRDFDNIDIYVLEEKLNIFFEWVRNAFSEKDNLNVVSNYYGVGKRNQYVEGQLFYIDFIEMILQVLSTIFIAIGRFQELKSNKKK